MLNYQRNFMFYRILDGFFRNWLVFLITLVGVSGVVAVALILRGAKYSAEATIRLGGQEVSELNSALGIGMRGVRNSQAQINAVRFQDLMRDTLPGGFVDRVIKTANLGQPINT
ncbi:MAG: hypothetical protein ACOVT5_12400, partial [Armatimonadaceae bacterium]